ncbi:MAG: hypothetical protein FWE06_04105 [Oscillospiraceae bacterium]|nr:hypothetical protein [Oscillospiraceae bacterium]
MLLSIQRILDIAKSKNLSEQAICRLLDADSSKVEDWKAGRSIPVFAEIATLSACFNVSIDYLLGTSDDPVLQGAKKDPQLKWGEFQYAVFKETETLTDEQRQSVLDFAQTFKARKDESNECTATDH